MRLYHFTARHLAEQIIESGHILPRPQVLPGAMPGTFRTVGGPAIVWLTDMDEPDVLALGLTSDHIPYSRVSARFTVEAPSDTVKWHIWASRQGLPRWVKAWLTMSGRIDHHHWFVTASPIPVTASDVIWLDAPEAVSA